MSSFRAFVSFFKSIPLDLISLNIFSLSFSLSLSLSFSLHYTNIPPPHLLSPSTFPSTSIQSLLFRKTLIPYKRHIRSKYSLSKPTFYHLTVYLSRKREEFTISCSQYHSFYVFLLYLPLSRCSRTYNTFFFRSSHEQQEATTYFLVRLYIHLP